MLNELALLASDRALDIALLGLASHALVSGRQANHRRPTQRTVSHSHAGLAMLRDIDLSEWYPDYMTRHDFVALDGDIIDEYEK
jgi:hypothetical protein